MADYSIHVLEYCHVPKHHKGGMIYGAHNEGTLNVPYCYVLIRGKGHVAMVDVGYNHRDWGKHLGDLFGVANWHPPRDVLGELGLTPESIDSIFITHAHFDHFGNVAEFPNATFYMQREEIEKWVWAMALPDRMRWVMMATDPSDILRGVGLAAQGRLRLVEGAVENILPGIDLHLARDSHTYGSMWVTVRNDGRAQSEDAWILAGDLIYQYANLKNDGAVIGVETMYNPVGFAVGNITNLILATEAIMKQVGHDYRRVIPVHEQGVADNFPSRITKNGLRISEICLADGAVSAVA